MFLDVECEITKINKNVRNFMIFRRYLRTMRLLQKYKDILRSKNNVDINILNDITIDEASLESMTDLEKIFRLQTLLRRYAPCE